MATAMEEYAKTIKVQRQSGTFAREGEIPMLFPMYTMPLEEVLKLEEMKPHEKLMKEDILVHFVDEMGRAVFVSHQWLCPWKPDPKLAQFRHLQLALKNLLSTSKKSIDRESTNEFAAPSGPSIPIEEFRKKPLFIWYDYFSIPQIDSDSWSPSDLDKPIEEALNSIAAYIARSTFFFVLCPVVENPDCTELFGPSTWASRGWCRLEKTVRELLPEGNSFVVIHDANHMEAILTPANSLVLAGPSGEGSFGIGEDRERLGRVLFILLKKLVLHHLSTENFLAYRTYLNLQSYYLRGFALETAQLFHPIPDLFGSISEVFLAQNGFQNIKEVDQNGWSPLCYAVLRGDPHIVRSLVADAADPNAKTKKNHPIIGLAAGLSVSAIGAFFGHKDCLQALLESAADVTLGLNPPMCGAALGNHPECIQMLCQFGDSPSRTGFIDVSAIVQASAHNSVEAVRELLRQRPTLNLSRTLSFAMWNRGVTAEMVGQLVDAKADVNEQLRLPWRSVFGMAFFLHGLLYRWGVRRTTGTRIAYHSVGATPLMFAIIRGQFEGAAALLVAKAQVDVPNARNKTALDLAQELGVPQFLMDALEGNLTVCSRMVSSAMTNRFLVSHVV